MFSEDEFEDLIIESGEVIADMICVPIALVIGFITGLIAAMIVACYRVVRYYHSKIT